MGLAIFGPLIIAVLARSVDRLLGPGAADAAPPRALPDGAPGLERRLQPARAAAPRTSQRQNRVVAPAVTRP